MAARILALFWAFTAACTVHSFAPVGKFQRKQPRRLQESLGDSEELQARRQFLTSIIGGTTALGAPWLLPPQSLAEITDETDAYATNWWTDGGNKGKAASPPVAETPSAASPQSQRQVSDEVEIVLFKADLKEAGGLGLELADIEFRTNLRVYVKSVRPESLASLLGIQKGWVVVSLNGQSTERTNSEGVSRMLATALQRPDETVTFIFRDPKVFRNQLGNLSENANEVTTQVAPGGDNSQRMADGSLRRGRSETSQADQKVTVQQLVAPRLCTRGATTDDLLEISYLGTLADTGQVFDGSAVRINGQAIAGRGDDVTLYFVLGKQPFGQFPPGWDTGLFGMCVGERRRLVLPPVLAYGPAGLPRRGIPPDATLQYDITLVSLNGLATPQ